jgi:DNA-binding CsgD family transcriptional regulator
MEVEAAREAAHAHWPSGADLQDGAGESHVGRGALNCFSSCQAYGLTARESEVAQLVMHGFSTAEISAALSVSLNTVQDHLKKIFDKVGIHSRRELVARVFATQYEPHI